MSINYLAVALAAIAQFIVGAIWYMPIFGNAWGEIHGFKIMTKDEQKQAQKGMAPLLGVQFVVTIITTLVLAKLIKIAPDFSVYSLAGLVWIGFFVPVQISGIIFGGTDPKWIVKKTLIMAGGSLVCLVVAAAILGNM